MSSQVTLETRMNQSWFDGASALGEWAGTLYNKTPNGIIASYGVSVICNPLSCGLQLVSCVRSLFLLIIAKWEGYTEKDAEKKRIWKNIEYRHQAESGKSFAMAFVHFFALFHPPFVNHSLKSDFFSKDPTQR